MLFISYQNLTVQFPVKRPIRQIEYLTLYQNQIDISLLETHI